MGSGHFERLYASSTDPWGYCTNDYEREKYARTLAALPEGPLGAVLEVGCSIGVFTEQLSPRCERLVAIDFSTRALRLARARLRGRGNVRLVRASFPEETPAGRWDLVVCSEVLYYLGEPELPGAVSWLAEQLKDGVCLVAVSWRGVGSSEPWRGDEVHDLLAAELASWHTLDNRQPGYRLDRFDGDGR